MFDTYGAYKRLKFVQDLVGIENDTVLDAAVIYVLVMVNHDVLEYKEGTEVKRYRRQDNFNPSTKLEAL